MSADGLDVSARILGIADRYEAVTADRPYRAAMAVDDAVAILRKDAGSAFDPAMMEVAAELALNGTLARIAEGSEDPFATLARPGAPGMPLHGRATGNAIRVA